MATVFAYCVSLLSGIIARYIYGILFGFLNVMVNWQVFSVNKIYFNKLYLHILWISSEFIFALITIIVLKALGQTTPGLIIYFLFISPSFIFAQTSFRRPENLFYFDVQGKTPMEKFRAVNRWEALSRIVGIFICLLILR